MEKVLIIDLAKNINQEVSIQAWVANFRSSGKIAFWQLRDGSGFVQAILNSDTLDLKKWEWVYCQISISLKFLYVWNILVLLQNS
jgi:asparaginyl-tRNA synthetase